MFWLPLFLIVLGALAYRRTSLPTAVWVMAGLIVLYGILGDLLILFLILAFIWAVIAIAVAVPTLRQEWLSRTLFTRFRKTVRDLPPETRSALDSHDHGCNIPLLEAPPDWAALPDIAVPVLNDSQRGWLDRVIDPACTALLNTPDDPEARNQLAAAAAGVVCAESETSLSHEERTDPRLRASACARAAAALNGAAQPPCSALRVGWLAVLQQNPADGSAPVWLAGALVDVAALAPAAIDTGWTLQSCGRARLTTATNETGNETTAALCITLRNGVHATHRAKRYALLVDVINSNHKNGAHGGTCIVLDAETPGLEVHDQDGEPIVLYGTQIMAPFSALAGGLRSIGHGEAQLSAAVAHARAVNKPALLFGQALPVALSSAWHARLHGPGDAALTRYSAVREALATTAVELYAANALSAWTTTTMGKKNTPVGLAAIADVQVTKLCADIGVNALELGNGTPLEAFARRRIPTASVRSRTELGLQILGHCHPFFRAAWRAANDEISAESLQVFDNAWWRQVGHVLSGSMDALFACFGLNPNRTLPKTKGTNSKYVRRVNRAHICLIFVVDLVLLSRRDKTLSDDAALAAIGDAVSRLQAARAVIWKTGHDTNHPATGALLRSNVVSTLGALQNDLDILIHELPVVLRGIARALTTPLGRWRIPRGPHDTSIAMTWLCEGDAERYFHTLLPASLPEYVSRLRRAFNACKSGETLASRFPGTGQAGFPWDETGITAAVEAGRIDADEAQQLHRWIRACAALNRNEDEVAEARSHAAA